MKTDKIKSAIGQLIDVYLELHRSGYGTVNVNYILDDLENLAAIINSEEEETATDCNEIEKELERFYLDVLCADSIIQQKATEIPNLIRYHNFPIMWEDLIDIARHFAKWGAEHRDRFLNWIRDLIKKGIEKPEEALNILKRIDALINDDSLWGEHLKK